MQACRTNPKQKPKANLGPYYPHLSPCGLTSDEQLALGSAGLWQFSVRPADSTGSRPRCLVPRHSLEYTCTDGPDERRSWLIFLNPVPTWSFCSDSQSQTQFKGHHRILYNRRESNNFSSGRTSVISHKLIPYGYKMLISSIQHRFYP